MPVLLGALALGTAGPAAWAAPQATSTALTAGPEAPTSGTVMDLTATVTTSPGTVKGGSVTFTDTFNGVSEVLGTVQVQSANGTAGTAILETEVGGIGIHQFVAVYGGTSALATSTSATQSVTFYGPYSSATALAVSGVAGNYTLTGTVSAFGPNLPTGNVTFVDTNSNATLGTAALTTTPATQFTPYTSYPLANLNNGNTGGTNGPAIGDFNGDGHLDYAVPANSGSVFILLGKGDGTFTTGTAITTASPFEPTSVVVGDFNGDGNQDLAVLSANGIGSVNIYLGNGDGTFKAAKNYAVATATSGSRLLAVGDFNRDGIQDLVATNTTLNTVAVLLGNGDGSFKTAVPYLLSNTTDNQGQQPWNVVVGDINQDGFLDLAVASDAAGSVSILQGNGDGTFKPVIYVPTGATQVGSVALADFNGDGYPDLATTSAPDNNVYILLNNATSTIGFGTVKPYGMAGGPYYLTIGDFDRDGHPDIISANDTSSNSVGVLLNAGKGTFGAATYYGVGAGSIFANVGDINGDDRVDLTAVTNNGLSVLLSGQAETAFISNVVVTGCTPQSVVATYDGDTNYATSTSAASSLTNSVLATTLALSLTPPNGAAGTQVMLQATLSPYAQGGTTTNGEPVSFYNNGTLIGTAPLSSGVAVLNYVLPNSSYSFVAKYAGECSYQASNSGTPITGTPLLGSTLTWANPAPIAYGTKLGPTQLNATDNAVGGGTFAYTPPSGTVLQPGTQTLSVTFTPTNASYGQETATVQIVVQPATTITWPQPTPITYGTPLSGFQLDATASTGVVSVPLSYNVTGIYPPKSTYAQTASFDNDGYSYSTNTLTGTVVWNGLTFTLGPNNAPDAVATPNADPSCTGGGCASGPAKVIPLPAGNYTNLYMLGAMVNNINANQTFIVTYTDNSTLTFNQNMSDWFNAAGWPGEAVVSCSEDRNFDDGTTQPDSACLYGYQIPLDPTKTVASVQLPGTRNIVMLAMDLTTPSIPGTFTYTPPAGTIEPVGTDTLSVAFTPTDTVHYQPASATVSLVVDPPIKQLTTTISWPTPAPIAYGTPLSATQLDAVAMGPANPTPVIPTNQLQVISTSTDGTPYSLAGFDNLGNTYSYNLLNNGQVNYSGSTFTLGQPNIPDALTNGAVYSLTSPGNYSGVFLIGAAISAQAKVPFTLTYSDGTTANATVNMSAWTASAGNAGETVLATMTYANNQAGNKVSGKYYLYGYQLTANSNKTLVSVTLPNTRNVVIMALGFGNANTNVVVPGTYAYTPDAPTIEPVGTDTLSVTFTPSNPNGYTSATGTTQLVVTKATPVITWPTPAPINVNQQLGNQQLDATAATPQGANLLGTFVYNPAAGFSFNTPGIYPLNVTFTPNDTTHYTKATATVNIVVGNPGNGVTSTSGAIPTADANCCFFSQPTPYTVTVTGSLRFFIPTGTVTVTFNGQTLGSGQLKTGPSSSSVNLLLNSVPLSPGNNNVTLNYSGDSIYPATSTPAVLVLRNPAITVNPAVPGQTVTTSIPYRFVNPGTLTFTDNPHAAASTEFTTNTSGGQTCKNNHTYTAGQECNFVVAFDPLAPGIRKGVIQVNFAPNNGAAADPTLYLFLSGMGNAAQMTLGDGTQTTVSAALSQPQGVAFNPASYSTLFVANSFAGQIVTVPSSGGTAPTPWNTTNTGNLVYPADLAFDAFGDLIVTDPEAFKVFSFSPPPPSFTEQTVSTAPITVGLPTATKVDLAGNLYIADGSNTPQIVMVPGETSDTSYTPSVLNLGSYSVSFPQALAVDNAGANLYIADGDTNQVLQVGLNGTGTSQVNIGPCAPTVIPCAFNAPTGFAFDPNGDMYVTDGTPRLLLIPASHPTGQTILMPMTGLVNPSAITLDGAGNVYVSDFTGFVTQLAANAGTMTITGVGGTQTTTLMNTGNLGLTFKSLSITTGGANFTEGDTCKGNTIAPGGSCTITVTSKSAGSPSATLTIVSNNAVPTNATIAINP
ncbi:MAG TPA: FG-GAP-like repeat-containing protein [Acidobacteriaceae bacterium]|nr:FG-GAP-like repeat-containing protein [Acidobacteriaceae bacterium]